MYPKYSIINDKLCVRFFVLRDLDDSFSCVK